MAKILFTVSGDGGPAGSTGEELLSYLQEEFSKVLRPHGKEVAKLVFVPLAGQDPLLAKERIYLQLRDYNEAYDYETNDLF